MESILNMLKSLYKGENVAKKHWLLVLLLVLPTITGAVVGYIDKETPKELFIIILIAALILLVLSILPYIGLSGMALSFMHNRYHNKEEGIPLLNKDMFVTGIKAIPLYLVWGVYWCLFGLLVITLCFLPVIIPSVMVPEFTNNLGLFIGMFALSMLFMFLACFVFYLLVPFSAYVSVTYAKTFEYTNRLFNPLIIIEYIKKSFKNSVLVALKYLLVNIVVSFVSSFVYVFGFIILFIIGIFAAVSVPENVELTTVPWFVVLSILIASAMGLVQVYLSTIIGYGMVGNLIDVYKSEVDTIEE